MLYKLFPLKPQKAENKCFLIKNKIRKKLIFWQTMSLISASIKSWQFHQHINIHNCSKEENFY